MRVIFPFFLLGVLLGFPLRAQSLFELASKYHKEGKDSVALEILTTLYKAHSEDTLGAKALLLRSKLYLSMGDTSKAIGDLNTLSKSPFSSISFRAIETLTKIQPAGKANSGLLYRLALQSENREERLRGFKLALKGFIENGDYHKAADLLRWMIVELPQERESLQILLGNVLLKMGDINEAKLLLQRYHDRENTLIGLIHIEEEEGDTPSAFIDLLKLGKPLPLIADIFVEWGDTASLDSLLRNATGDTRFAYHRAYLAVMKGDSTLAESLANQIKEPLKKADILLRLGKYKNALNLIKDTTKEALILKSMAFLSEENLIQANECLSKCPSERVADSLRYALSFELFRHGLFKEALFNLNSIKAYTPMDPIYNLKVSLLLKLGMKREADSLSKWLYSWGFHTTSLFTAEDLLPILNKFYQGAAPGAVAKELYKMGAYKETRRLLSSSQSLDQKEREILAETETRLFLSTGDTMLAIHADSLFSTLPFLPQGYWILHRYWKPESARLPSSYPNLTDTSLEGFIISLAAQGRIKEARNLSMNLTGDLRNDALFSVFLVSGNLDSAFAYLNLKEPKNILKLGEAFFKDGRDEAAARLLGLLERSALKNEEKARFLEIEALVRAGYWKKVEDKGADYLERFPWSVHRKEIASLTAKAMLRNAHPKHALFVVMRACPPDKEALLSTILGDIGDYDLSRRFSLNSPKSAWISALDRGDWDALVGLPLPNDPEIIKKTVMELLGDRKNQLAGEILESADSLKIMKGPSLTLHRILVEALSDTTSPLSEFANKLPLEMRGEFYYRFGIISFKRGNKKIARAAFFKAFGLAEGTLRGKVAFKLATLLFGEGRHEEATDYYRMAFELVGDPETKKDALHNLAVVFNKRHLPDSALSVFETLCDSFPFTEEALDAKFSIAYQYMNQGRFKEANNIFTSERGEMPTAEREAERTYWEGHSLFSLKDYKGAIRDFRILKDAYSGIKEWGITGEVELARSLFLSGKKEEAKSIYMDIIQRRGEEDPFGKLAREELSKIGRP